MWPFTTKHDNDIPTYSADNTIASGSAVRGDLNGPGGFRVDGNVDGSIESDGAVVIGENGTVEGSIRGKDIVVLGTVTGDVRSTGHLEIGPKGRVVGDITTGSFRMHKGGVFRGTSRMAEDLVDPLAALPRIATSEAPRVRTLPPPAGAVPPPADLEELSEERLRVSGEN